MTECPVCLEQWAMFPLRLMPCRHLVCTPCAHLMRAAATNTPLLCMMCRGAVTHDEVYSEASAAVLAHLAATGDEAAVQRFLQYQDARDAPPPPPPPPPPPVPVSPAPAPVTVTAGRTKRARTERQMRVSEDEDNEAEPDDDYTAKTQKSRRRAPLHL